MKRLLSILLAAAAIGLAVAPADAALTTIGTATYGSVDYNLIHDDDLGIVWLDYTSLFDIWQNKFNWAARLNNSGVLTYSINPGFVVTWRGDWRLPNMNPVTPHYVYGVDGTTSGGYNITSSEMGHLYYTELGNLGFIDKNGFFQNGAGLRNIAPFNNLFTNNYWSGTVYSLDANFAWNYFLYSGGQRAYAKFRSLCAVAVRPVDVVVTPVPEPGTMLLLGSGIAGAALWRKRFGLKRP